MAMYRCGGGSGGVTPTPITPSNASPAAMTNGTVYESNGNGYAIQGYSTATPSNSSPYPLASGGIYKCANSGYGIDSYYTLTPSDSSPASIVSDRMYKATAGGYAIANNPATLTPSNSSPATISDGSIYKANGAGYAIESYSTVNSAGLGKYNYISKSAGSIVKITDGIARIYGAIQLATKIGTFTFSGVASQFINIGFEPQYIAAWKSDGGVHGFIYNEDISTEKYLSINTASSSTFSNLGSGNGRLLSISSSGFAVECTSSNYNGEYRYFAVGSL